MKKSMSDPSLVIAITGLVISLGGVVGALVNSLLSAKKGQLETIQEAIHTVQAENKRLRERLDEADENEGELRKKLDAMQLRIDTYELERRSNLRRIEQLEGQVAALEKQIITLGFTPVTKEL